MFSINEKIKRMVSQYLGDFKITKDMVLMPAGDSYYYGCASGCMTGCEGCEGCRGGCRNGCDGVFN